MIEDKIKDKRNDELKILRQDNLVSYFIVTTLYFFPQILGAVVFTVYIGAGNKLDLGTAFAIMTVFNLMKDPLRLLPMVIGMAIQFMVSMRRI